MQTTKNTAKTEDVKTRDPNRAGEQACGGMFIDMQTLIELFGTDVIRELSLKRAERYVQEKGRGMNQPSQKSLRDMLMDADILVCVSMAAAQGVIALYQERVGELDVISEMAVTGLQHSIHLLSDAMEQMRAYV